MKNNSHLPVRLCGYSDLFTGIRCVETLLRSSVRRYLAIHYYNHSRVLSETSVVENSAATMRVEK
jgi:hypothetical protein